MAKSQAYKQNQLYEAVSIGLIVLNVVLLVVLVGMALDKKVDVESPSITGESNQNLGDIDDLVIGDINAPVTIIEYSDFECPYCARFYNGAYQEIKTKYVDTGKVKIIYKDFPLTRIHPNAQKAGEAVHCSMEQGKGLEMHDRIFETSASPTVDNLKKWAVEIGLNSAEFDECLDSDKYAEEVLADQQEGVEAGVTGTPSFIINGQSLSGARPFADFERIIEAELAKLE